MKENFEPGGHQSTFNGRPIEYGSFFSYMHIANIIIQSNYDVKHSFWAYASTENARESLSDSDVAIFIIRRKKSQH